MALEALGRSALTRAPAQREIAAPVEALDRLQQLIGRLATYPRWQVVVELFIIWIVVYVVVRFIQGTRAAAALKVLLFLVVMSTLLVRTLARGDAFDRLRFLYDNFLTIFAIALIVIFQPELRRGLIRLGERPFFRRNIPSTSAVIESIVEACAFLAKAKFGALIVIERENTLRGLVQGGTVLGADVSARLLQTIFFPGSALHDLAVIVRGSQIAAAGVQLPMAEPEDMPDAALGSRHRAAVGLTKESDALVVVVSEETGLISLSERGRLIRGLKPDELRGELATRLRSIPIGDEPEPAEPKRTPAPGRRDGAPASSGAAAGAAASQSASGSR